MKTVSERLISEYPSGVKVLNLGEFKQNTNPNKRNSSLSLGAMFVVAHELGIDPDADPAYITFAAHAKAADHVHKRKELLVPLSGKSLYVHEEADGKFVETDFQPAKDGDVKAIFMPPWVGHLLITGKEEVNALELRDLSSEFRSLEDTPDSIYTRYYMGT
jgi:uncharacterized RmlC-like cupin family protein